MTETHVTNIHCLRHTPFVFHLFWSGSLQLKSVWPVRCEDSTEVPGLIPKTSWRTSHPCPLWWPRRWKRQDENAIRFFGDPVREDLTHQFKTMAEAIDFIVLNDWDFKTVRVKVSTANINSAEKPSGPVMVSAVTELVPQRASDINKITSKLNVRY